MRCSYVTVNKMENYYVYCSDFNSDTPLKPKAGAVAKLPTALDSKEGYEIGLLEAHVCAAWANQTNVGVTLEKEDIETGKQVIEFTLHDTLIDTLERLYTKINEAIEKRLVEGEDVDKWAKFGLMGRGNSNKIKIEAGVKATFSPNLCALLRLNSAVIDNSEGQQRLLTDAASAATTFKFPAPWQHNIYVCCNGTEESFANNGILRTLGTIHIDEESTYGQYITVKFNNPIYRKWVGDEKIEEIALTLVDEHGDQLVQRRGHVWAALHIRKISDPSFNI